MADNAIIDEQAIGWHLRLPDLAGHEWEQFTAWLESAPEHRAAYDRLVEADAFLAAAAPALPAAMPMAASVSTALAPRRWAPAVAAAAAGLALFSAWALWPDAQEQFERTRPGTTKRIAFADGTRIDLNGNSALALEQGGPRAVRLDRGEAMFRVRHSAKPFTVEAGGYSIRDLGTVFNVELTDRTLRIDVSEGSVQFDPGGAGVTLAAGEGLTLDRDRKLVVQRRSRGAGGWLNGEMVFQDSRLDDVAAALYRRYGIRIELSAGLSGRPFTGNILNRGDEAGDVAHFARLIGAQIHRDGEVWVLAPEGSAR